MNSCLFCRIASGEIPSDKVYENNDLVAFKDLNPQAPNHILIIPRQHVARFSDLDKEASALIGRIMIEISNLAERLGFVEDGFRVVVNNGERAGQSVFHLHFHLLSGRDFGWPPG